MIQLRHEQPSLWHQGLAKDIEDLWESWMREADRLLEDAVLIENVYEAQRRRLTRFGQVIGTEVIRDLHERLVALAQEHGVVKSRKLRVDTTVVETDIHYPTDSGLLGDGGRVLTRTMKRIETNAGGLKQKIRNRVCTVKKRVVAIARHATERTATGRMAAGQYAGLLTVTRKSSWKKSSNCHIVGADAAASDRELAKHDEASAARICRRGSSAYSTHTRRSFARGKEQAHGVRQAGGSARGGESDHHRLSGIY